MLPLCFLSAKDNWTRVKLIVPVASQNRSDTHFIWSGHSVMGREEIEGEDGAEREGEEKEEEEVEEVAREEDEEKEDGQQTPPLHGTTSVPLWFPTGPYGLADLFLELGHEDWGKH